MTAVCVLALASGTIATADTETETFDAAVYMLKSCTSVRRDGQHHRLLRALRHLADPELAPLFTSLVDSPYTLFKIHGFLGATECDPDHRLDLTRIAAIKDPSEQAQIITATMDSGLLSDEQAQQITDWDGLDNGIKVVVARQLIKAGKFNKPEVLEQAGRSENLARRYLGLFLLGQQGDAAALARLDELDLSDDPKRDQVREMLLQVAVQHEFASIGPWALQVSRAPDTGRKLRLLALKTALRFDAPGAADAWGAQFAAEDANGADRKRLALLALDVAPLLAPGFFVPLIGSEDTLVDQIGKTGRAITTGRGIADEVQALIATGYPVGNTWALRYAGNHAGDADAVAILEALVSAYETGPDRGRIQRLDDAVSSTQLLFERDPEAATTFLRPILAAPASDPLLVQGVLLGLIRCTAGDPHRVIAGLPPFEARAARNLALLLRARAGQGLSVDALEELGLIVRGGGLRQGALRVQASWLYLKITNQVEPALAQVLEE